MVGGGKFSGDQNEIELLDAISSIIHGAISFSKIRSHKVENKTKSTKFN